MVAQERQLGTIEIQQVPQAILKIREAWHQAVEQPEQLDTLKDSPIHFAAGGGLVTVFGEESSEIWKAVEQSAEAGKLEIAGITFSIEELAQMGAFYRFLQSDGAKFHCIDERLVDDAENQDVEVHCSCGACAAVQVAVAKVLESVTNGEEMENTLLRELSADTKQGIYPDMPNHTSLAVLVGFDSAVSAQGGLRDQLKTKKALPFNVTIPLKRIAEFLQESADVDADLLISTLVKWNVQIARNIIGSHNTLKEHAQHAAVIVDIRGSSHQDLLDKAIAEVEKIPFGETITIS